VPQFSFGCTCGAVGIGFGYSAEGPVSTANGVVYACSPDPVGPSMVAMDAATGAITREEGLSRPSSHAG